MSETPHEWKYLERRPRVELPATVHQRETHLGMDSLLRIHE